MKQANGFVNIRLRLPPSLAPALRVHRCFKGGATSIPLLETCHCAALALPFEFSNSLFPSRARRRKAFMNGSVRTIFQGHWHLCHECELYHNYSKSIGIAEILALCSDHLDRFKDEMLV